jgi:hypothetical protein
LRIIRRTATGTAAFPPQRWTDVLPDVLAQITRKINPPRRHRTSPRAVRRARHNNYRIKKPGEAASTRHDRPATIQIHHANPRAA